MGDLLTADNLPVIIGIVLSAHVLNWLRELIQTFITWRRGASEKEKSILADTLAQLERCSRDRDRVTDERDRYRQALGRRDYLLLANGIPLPDDGKWVNPDVGSSEPEPVTPEGSV